MSARAWLLLSWIVVGAALLAVHALVVFQVMRARNLRPRQKALALLPPAAPIVAWLGGRRSGPIAWLALVLSYVVLRLLE